MGIDRIRHCSSITCPAGAIALADLLNGGLGVSALQGPPDITVSFVDVSFNATTGILTLDGFAESLDVDGNPPPDDYALFGEMILTVPLTAAGAMSGPGTFTIGQGSSPTIPGGGPLLTGTVTQFGFQESSPFQLFDFIATDVTGDAASLGFSPTVAIALGAGSWQSGHAFSGSFAADFHNTGFGALDLFPVPEPSSVALALIGLAAMGAFVGRRSSILVRPTRNL